MPALVDQPQVLAVRQQWNQTESTTVTTKQYFKYTGSAPSNATCVALATAIHGYAAADLLSFLSDNSGINETSVTDLTSPTSGFGVALLAAAGTRTGGNLPAGTSALLSCKIERRYRGGKPRIYLPFGTAPDVNDDQTWTSAFVTGLTTAYASYIASVISTTSGGTSITEFVNVSYYDGFTSVENPVTHRWRNVALPRSVAIPPDPIISFAINPNFASQRRRNRIV
jgi:hypothetical protein